MVKFDWENPFGDADAEALPPTIWTPSSELSPVSFKAIKARQKRLLPHIHELRKNALQVLRRIGGEAGGSLFLKNTERPVMVEVLYRDPRYKHVLHTFGPMPVNSHPVTFSAEKRPDVPLFDRLLPAQMIQDQPKGEAPRKAVVDAEMQMGLVRRVGLSDGEVSPYRIVVYPQVLGFIGHWISRIKSPIADIRYYEADPPNIRAGHDPLTVFARQPTTGMKPN